jgi:hypothetical protein
MRMVNTLYHNSKMLYCPSNPIPHHTSELGKSDSLFLAIFGREDEVCFSTVEGEVLVLVWVEGGKGDGCSIVVIRQNVGALAPKLEFKQPKSCFLVL